jgi:hypothetical protein
MNFDKTHSWTQFFNPHSSGNFLVFDNLWKNLRCACIGYLLKKDGEWNDITDFNAEACSELQHEDSRLILKRRRTLLLTTIQNWQGRMSQITSFFIRTQTGMLKIAPFYRKLTHIHVRIKLYRNLLWKGSAMEAGQVRMDIANQYTTDSSDGASPGESCLTL